MEHKVGFSLESFPIDEGLLNSSGLLLGGNVAPLGMRKQLRSQDSKSIPSLPAGQATEPRSKHSTVRCQGCEGYWFPGCVWRGDVHWFCGLCGFENDIIDGVYPNKQEMTEFTVMYCGDDDTEDESERCLIHLFLLDMESNSSFLEASVLAIAKSVQLLVDTYAPIPVRVGLVLSYCDSLVIHEFFSMDDDQPQQDFYSTVVTKLQSNSTVTTTSGRTDQSSPQGFFRVELKDATSVLKATTCNVPSSFMNALSDLKQTLSYSNDRIEGAQPPSSSIGQALHTLLSFTSTNQQGVLGSHVSCFTEHVRPKHLQQEHLQALCSIHHHVLDTEHGTGLDVYLLDDGNMTEEESEWYRALKQCVLASGGHLNHISYGDLEYHTQHEPASSCAVLLGQVSRRLQTKLCFRAMIRARSCPELVIGKGSATQTTHHQVAESQSLPLVDTNASTANDDWWLIHVIKRVASNLFQTNPSHTHSISHKRDRDDHGALGNYMLGPGKRLSYDDVWVVPVADRRSFLLAFEIDFVSSSFRLDSIMFPKQIAVQFASTFVAAGDGNRRLSRFVRIETKASKLERPSRVLFDLWKHLDAANLFHLLIRILHFHGDYVNLTLQQQVSLLLDWCAKCITLSGLNRFEHLQLSNMVFGYIRRLPTETPPSIQHPSFKFHATRYSDEYPNLVLDLNPTELAMYCWPRLSRYIQKTTSSDRFEVKVKLPLSMKTILQDTTSSSMPHVGGFTLNCISHILVIPLSQQSEELLQTQAQSFVDEHPHLGTKVQKVPMSMLRQSDSKPSQDSARELLLDLMLEDPTEEYPQGLPSFLASLELRAKSTMGGM